jgi:hypothetical protein
MSKEQVIARHQAATEEPFWRRPLPPIPGPRGIPPVVKVSADNLHEPEPVVNVEPARSVYDIAKEAEHALDLARQEARECRDATLRARTAFAKALADWNGSGTVMTQVQQARQFIATSNAERAARAAAGQGIRHAGVTRTARAYAQGNQQRGGGRAYVRGPDGTKAYSKAEAMTLEANRLRIAAAAAAAAAAKPRGQ